MKNHFYSHIVTADSVIVALNDLDLSTKEKEHLVALLNSNIHTVVLNVVLSQIPKEDKQLFLEHLETNDDQKIWKFLHTRTIAIEDKINREVKLLLKEFHDDIKETHKNK